MPCARRHRVAPPRVVSRSCRARMTRGEGRRRPRRLEEARVDGEPRCATRVPRDSSSQPGLGPTESPQARIDQCHLRRSLSAGPTALCAPRRGRLIVASVCVHCSPACGIPSTMWMQWSPHQGLPSRLRITEYTAAELSQESDPPIRDSPCLYLHAPPCLYPPPTSFPGLPLTTGAREGASAAGRESRW